MNRLQDESDNLQIICSVDVFGEGVDIPSVSHVLLLRPTQSFTVFLQQLGRGLRIVPEKEYLVVLDFVGNFRQSYVAPLALQGYHSVQEYINTPSRDRSRKPPSGCYVSPDEEVRRIWDDEIRRVLNVEHLFDYKDMARHKDHVVFPLTRVESKLRQMPLHFLSNKANDFFILDREKDVFSLKPEMLPYWSQSYYREMVSDRVTFTLKRYFYLKERKNKLG